MSVPKSIVPTALPAKIPRPRQTHIFFLLSTFQKELDFIMDLRLL